VSGSPTPSSARAFRSSSRSRRWCANSPGTFRSRSGRGGDRRDGAMGTMGDRGDGDDRQSGRWGDGDDGRWGRWAIGAMGDRGDGRSGRWAIGAMGDRGDGDDGRSGRSRPPDGYLSGRLRNLAATPAVSAIPAFGRSSPPSEVTRPRALGSTPVTPLRCERRFLADVPRACAPRGRLPAKYRAPERRASRELIRWTA
jgi:hypothetical protein